MTVIAHDPSPAPARQPSTRGLVGAAYATLFLLVVCLGGMAATISLSGAVVTSGRLVVASYPKPIQHLKGGTVAELLVANGDTVKANQLLIRLDETQTRANLGIVEKRLKELRTRAVRLLAEEGGQEALAFPEDLIAVSATDPDMAKLIDGEKRLFDARRLSQSRRKDQLGERIAQLGQQIEGLNAQIEGKRKEAALVEKETSGVGQLVGQQLLSITRLHDLQSQSARLEGELGGLISSVAEAKGKITETELQRLQIDDDVKSQSASDLREVQGQIAEYEERAIAARDDLAHIDIRAPQDGIIQDLAVHTSGAVITPGNPIMTIVPVQDNLLAEVRIAPQDIDQIFEGQKAIMRFSAFNQRTTPEISGHVVQISPDLTIDQKTGTGFYLVRVAPKEKDIPKLGAVKLVPGMPIEAFVETGDRTILSYLMKPATDQISRAFRGD